MVRVLGRWLLGLFLILAGTAHLTVARDTFGAQVPDWLPFEDAVVLVSGVVEIALGLAVLALAQHRVLVGWIVAAFFVAVFPGNINQLVTGTDAFGLDSTSSRVIRLFFQPLLIAWALWSTGAWATWRSRRRRL
ncbi:DoxX family protein [Aeromicrobium sp. CF3.5]|uniref:DoxX family protein n=1 Tax=Aeromicrobium sp. CF3.5 TaxID=3373078 RepID=UPI003EE7690D